MCRTDLAQPTTIRQLLVDELTVLESGFGSIEIRPASGESRTCILLQPRTIAIVTTKATVENMGVSNEGITPVPGMAQPTTTGLLTKSRR